MLTDKQALESYEKALQNKTAKVIEYRDIIEKQGDKIAKLEEEIKILKFHREAHKIEIRKQERKMFEERVIELYNSLDWHEPDDIFGKYATIRQSQLDKLRSLKHNHNDDVEGEA